MKFLTDENIALFLINVLRDAGFEVKDVKNAKINYLFITLTKFLSLLFQNKNIPENKTPMPNPKIR
jgi:hypothetical protein